MRAAEKIVAWKVLARIMHAKYPSAVASRPLYPMNRVCKLGNLRCWQCGALQQPGGYPLVDHHQPEQPVSLPRAPQPQFDNDAELALVAQFQE
ncbi:hypothetical protein QJQ45_016196 [Haematococcus lacustris]|nr:hypothetical protein QJQ45_016196 [Haematococcus lacustris]